MTAVPGPAACAGFDTQPWYAALFDFELGGTHGAGNGSAGGESDLVPQLVSQVLALLPLVQEALRPSAAQSLGGWRLAGCVLLDCEPDLQGAKGAACCWCSRARPMLTKNCTVRLCACRQGGGARLGDACDQTHPEMLCACDAAQATDGSKSAWVLPQNSKQQHAEQILSHRWLPGTDGSNPA